MKIPCAPRWCEAIAWRLINARLMRRLALQLPAKALEDMIQNPGAGIAELKAFAESHRSMPGVPGLMQAYQAGNVTLANAETFDILYSLAHADRLEPERIAGEIQSQLHYGRIEKVFEEGLHEYLMAFLDRIDTLNSAINRQFLVPDYA